MHRGRRRGPARRRPRRAGLDRLGPAARTASEAVVVTFDPDALPLDVLVEVHLRTHASASAHSMRDRYRSAVYPTSPAQAEAVRQALAALEADLGPLVTQVLPLRAFRLNDPAYLHYYRTRPDAPFCRAHIDPKLRALRARFGGRIRPDTEMRGK